MNDVSLPEITAEGIANGLLAFVVGMLSWLGYSRVKAQPDKSLPASSGRHTAISGVPFVHQHAEQIIEAVNENTDAVRAKTSETVALTNAINELRSDVRELSRELIRQNR